MTFSRNPGAATCGSCHRCETVPEHVGAGGHLIMWFPLQHTFGKLYAHLKRAGHSVTSEAGQLYLRVAVPEDMDDLVREFDACLLVEERRAIRVLHRHDDAPIAMADLGKVTSLDEFAGLATSGWLLSMLSDRRLTSHFQPIVHAADTSKVFAHEALVRGIDAEGATVHPGAIFDAARTADLLFQVDLASRRSAIRQAAEHGIEEKVFINFLPSAIYDPVFCLKSTVAAVAEAGLSHDQVVFEVVESERAADLEHLKTILDFYRAEGFKVALDDVGSGYSSLNMIHELRPDFVKLDMALIRGVDRDPFKAAIAMKLLEIAQMVGIQTVAEGIETPGELQWVSEHGGDFVQGYLVARPQALPASNLPRLDAHRLCAA